MIRKTASLVTLAIIGSVFTANSAHAAFWTFTFDEFGNGLAVQTSLDPVLNPGTTTLSVVVIPSSHVHTTPNWDGAVMNAYTTPLTYTNLPFTLANTGAWVYATGEDQPLPTTSPAEPATYTANGQTFTNFDPGDALHFGGTTTDSNRIDVFSGSFNSELYNSSQWGGVPTASDATLLGGAGNQGYIGAVTGSGAEVNGVLTYTPSSSQEGFVTGGIRYIFFSDGSFVPEPCSLVVWSLLGVTGAALAYRRRRLI
jgi:hypothetical protein